MFFLGNFFEKPVEVEAIQSPPRNHQHTASSRQHSLLRAELGRFEMFEFYSSKKRLLQYTFPMLIWVVVSNILYFHPYLGKIPILTNIFHLGWNHQPVIGSHRIHETGIFTCSCLIAVMLNVGEYTIYTRMLRGMNCKWWVSPGNGSISHGRGKSCS